MTSGLKLASVTCVSALLQFPSRIPLANISLDQREPGFVFAPSSPFQRLRRRWAGGGRLNGIRQPVGVGVTSDNDRVAWKAARRLHSLETRRHTQEVWFNPREDNSILHPRMDCPLNRILFSVFPWAALPVSSSVYTICPVSWTVQKDRGWSSLHPTSFSLERPLKEDLRTHCPHRRRLDRGPAAPSAGSVGGGRPALQSIGPLLILKEHQPRRWHGDSVPPSALRPLFWSLSWGSLRQRD